MYRPELGYDYVRNNGRGLFRRKPAVAPNLARQVNATNRHTGNDLAVTGVGVLAASGTPTNVAPWLRGMVGDEPTHAASHNSFVVYHLAKLVETTGDMFGARA